MDYSLDYFFTTLKKINQKNVRRQAEDNYNKFMANSSQLELEQSPENTNSRGNFYRYLTDSEIRKCTQENLYKVVDRSIISPAELKNNSLEALFNERGTDIRNKLPEVYERLRLKIQNQS